MAFHLGPDVQAVLDGSCATLSWPRTDVPGAARLELPVALRWSLHRGEADTILGWYSPGLGRRIPAFTLLGAGRCALGAPLATRLEFLEAGSPPKPALSRQAVSWCAPDARASEAPEIRAEAK
jgi:hypothetical protein